MAKKSMFGWVKDQYTKRPAVVKVDLSGKTVIVVGANTGIGYEAAKQFASMHPGRLIMACRSKERGQAAVERHAAQTGCEAELWLVDLASFASVSSFADKFDKDGGRLDILVMNAGLIMPTYSATVDGWESCLQVNNIASPLLSLRLLPHMVRTAATFSTTPRLVTVASEVHYWAVIGKELIEAQALLATLSDETYCTPSRLRGRYYICKLLNILFTRALQDRLSQASSPVTAVSVNPSFCASELTRNVIGESRVLGVLVYIMGKALARTAEEGSRELVYAAVGGRAREEQMRGAFLSLSDITEPSDFVISKEGKVMQDGYWDELIGILSKADPKISGIVKQILS
ncbi:short-chain dehydrogenase [Hymenopellis radicata]|nr:short-chain dehydrogenase [Hymenopellis radicata]